MRRREPQRRAYDKLGQVCKGGNPAPGGRQSPAGTRQRAQHDRQPGGTMGQGPGPHPTGARGSQGGGFTAEGATPSEGEQGGQESLCGPLLRDGRGRERIERGPHGKVPVLQAREGRAQGHSRRRCWNTGQ